MSFPQESKTMDQIMRSHQEDLNLVFPSLNKYGMMWFRDDDVEIGDSFNSILTIYQPLFDPRDQDLIDMYLDGDEPNVLRHFHPNVPTFMYQDHSKLHELEESKCNPEVFSETKKKHKKHAFKIRESKQLKLQSSEYELPFSLSLKKFDSIEHSQLKLQKHYRTIAVTVDKDKGISHTCAYIFWKIMIDGETTDCSAKVNNNEHNVYAEALDRLRDPPGIVPPFVGDVVDNVPDAPLSSTSSEESAFPDAILNPALDDHVSRFSQATWNYLAGSLSLKQEEGVSPDEGLVLSSPSKRQKFNDSKPMDEDDVSL